MKNAKRALAVKYYDILTGLGMTAFDGFAPSTYPNEYCIIQNPVMVQGEGKNNFMTTVSITIDIVVRNSNFGHKRSEEIASDILDAINSDTVIDLSPDFQCVTTRLESSNNLNGLTDTDNVFRTLLRFEHNISQL